MADFAYQDLLPLGPDETPYRLLTTEGVSTVEAAGHTFLQVEPEASTLLTRTAMRDIAHLFRPGHLAQLAAILDDPEASDNDRFVALELLQNACISAGGVLPSCQDTGTAIVKAKKGQFVLTGGGDEEAIARGVYDTYRTANLRYTQMAPITMYEERNTGTNLPAEIEISAVDGDAYKFLFMAKGGGSANKSYLYQETKALLNPSLARALGRREDPHAGHRRLPALPPGDRHRRHLGGVHAEDGQAGLGPLPRHPADDRQRAGPGVPRRRARGRGPGGLPADRHRRPVRRQVLLPRRARHPAAPPRRLVPGGDRGQLLGRPPGAGQDHRGRASSSSSWRPTRPASCPSTTDEHLGGEVVQHRPAPADGRDPGRAVPLPDPHPAVAERADGRRPRHRPRQAQGAPRRRRAAARSTCRTTACTTPGPAKTPAGYASGSFGPTTAGRMDSYVDQFQAAGGSFVMLAKGNRSRAVTEACQRHGGFYLGSIGGPAARLAKDCIRKVEVLEYPELGMEAVWKIEVEDFPAFIVVDDKGNDFFEQVNQAHPVALSGH